ncbi:NUDIX hydrolase [Streptomyces sp. NPDC048665]|uniref:NUDIX hydrolase n=1 Tax=Streptomyces sp. NPDC048665 TaxID=3155490 RepID=UPI0034328160
MAVVVASGRVLMIRRRVQEGRLSWAFPGGKIEPSETAEAAAVREAGEEARVTVEAVQVLGERTHPDTGRRLVYVACRLVSGIATVGSGREVSEVAWVSRSGLTVLVPHGLYEPVHDYLGGVLGD